MAEERKWGMVVDIDRCTGCQACVIACQTENNILMSSEDIVQQKRAMVWIRIERYWEGEYPNIKARFIPVLCQHCENAPCEPVCPVYATYHNNEGLNVQVYNRCVGTRYCANNCPYHARVFNYWERHTAAPHMQVYPADARAAEPMNEYLNPDVTVRTKGLMEKCTFCLQRIRRVSRQATVEGRAIADGEVQPACVQSCPTGALVFGDLRDARSQVSKLAGDQRAYHLLEDLGTRPAVTYLKKVDPNARATSPSH
ncbi:MAG: 4Fe-4S dicluster domain-containing protein [Chloroflexi bacterium]|nr:4Fe-4S dicluster domain-containing protein [Chloroflexota bacterium]